MASPRDRSQRRLTHRQRAGKTGEAIARRELTQRGYRIIDANFRTRRGEIDLVAVERDQIVFVEVRSKWGGAFGSAGESITATKQERLVAVAQAYLQERDLASADWRIDVLLIDREARGHRPAIELIRNAVAEREG